MCLIKFLAGSLQPRLVAILAASFSIALVSQSAFAGALPGSDGDEYDETARVVRISYVQGEVSVRRKGNDGWDNAQVNSPLIEGDSLATGSDGRAELQMDAHNFIRLGSDSALTVVSLRTEGIALSLAEGTATARMASFDRNREYFEIDAPKTTVAAEERGLYRLDVTRDGEVRVAVRDGGKARIYSQDSEFTVTNGRTADLVNNGSDGSDWKLSAAATSDYDTWDRWNDERETFLASNLRYDNRDRYYDSDVWGAEELDSYGDWYNGGDYGWVWRPRVAVINYYNNWAPYRYGHWAWCAPYGWTWVGDEAWGWAPYHYGRWVYFNDAWCWAPRGYGYEHRRNFWRPALVAFAYVPGANGEQVCWYPLGYGQRDPRGRDWRQLKPGRRDRLQGHEVAELQRANPAYLRAVSSLPVTNFGQPTVRAQVAPMEVAKRAIAAQPVPGTLPIKPVGEGAPSAADAAAGNSANGANNRRLNGGALGLPARPAPPSVSLLQRSTGAARRVPGVSMIDDLRGQRLVNGPQRGVGGSSTKGDASKAYSIAPVTGANRPTLTIRPAIRQPIGEGTSVGNLRGSSYSSSPTTHTTTADRPPRLDRPVGSGDRRGLVIKNPPAPVSRANPVRPSSTESRSYERPVRPSEPQRAERTETRAVERPMQRQVYSPPRETRAEPRPQAAPSRAPERSVSRTERSSEAPARQAHSTESSSHDSTAHRKP